jgi:hypothetical protein
VKALLITLAIALPLWAALPNSTVYEVRTAGSNNNGGCFVTGSSGTDFSQQNAAQYTFSNLASSNGTNASPQVTSASHNFVATDVGNCLHVTAGTNWTQGFYRIVSVAANAATLDRAVGTSASLSSGTFAVGGAIQTLAQLVTSLSTCSGCIAYVKAGTYTTATQISITFTGSPAQQIIGYSASRGDNLPFTVQATGTITGVQIIHITGLGVLSNVIFDCNSQTATGGLNIDSNALGNNIEIKNSNAANAQLQISGTPAACYFCQVHGGASGGTVVNLNNGQDACWFCSVYSMTGASTVGFATAGGVLEYPTVYALTTATSIAIQANPSAALSNTYVNHCVIYNINGDGIQITNITALTLITNCVIDTTTNGVNNTSGTALRSGDFINDYNFTFNISGTAYLNTVAGAHSQALGTDPFVSPGTGNFALNNTAGGGATVNNGGSPTSLPGVIGTGFPAGGGLQPKVVTGGGSSVVP